MKNIYVGNISYATTEEQLTQLFGGYGAVHSAKVVKDNRTGRSKGFAFVEMEDGADAAIEAINGTELEGRTLRVAEAHAKEEGDFERPRRNDSRGPRRDGGYGGDRDDRGSRGPRGRGSYGNSYDGNR